MVTIKIVYGFVFVWYNDKLFIKTKSIIYATTMGEVLQDARHR